MSNAKRNLISCVVASIAYAAIQLSAKQASVRLGALWVVLIYTGVYAITYLLIGLATASDRKTDTATSAQVSATPENCLNVQSNKTWRCTCGRMNADNVSSCVCGVSKKEAKQAISADQSELSQ